MRRTDVLECFVLSQPDTVYPFCRLKVLYMGWGDTVWMDPQGAWPRAFQHVPTIDRTWPRSQRSARSSCTHTLSHATPIVKRPFYCSSMCLCIIWMRSRQKRCVVNGPALTTPGLLPRWLHDLEWSPARSFTRKGVVCFTPTVVGRTHQHRAMELSSAPAIVAAGFPSPAEEFRQPRLNVQQLLGIAEGGSFCERMAGSALTSVGIDHKDLLVISPSIEAVTNDLVVATVNGSRFIRRLVMHHDVTFLLPASPSRSMRAIPLQLGSSTLLSGSRPRTISKFKVSSSAVFMPSIRTHASRRSCTPAGS